ncbi:diacylglycerol/lipid kinase family protein [Zobellia barbeyronii]|uniref:YegS/Rv2252/BmrU family lipid kinase n=1 Tax=Zobellia barbeyronii TaxID=2748009 RepID=A0ABS5WDG5_9FLAO|nr:YegS/Rv2252/BmrU family lipid kinase [Zobellia barbeyronii]MBT2161279.1 YegS/Rv2252/BmrU family lipid kinase [Zobellia barbeyronii]
MIAIHFIVNPVAGHGRSLLTKEFLLPYFIRSHHHLVVKHSEYKNHAIVLTRESITQKADIIVACGGDGTINEVASCLVGTSIPLGIIPMGSGNGLASNLRIPKNLRKALAIIKERNVTKIDVGKINDRHFFSNMGIGFDATVIKHYESSHKRTLLGYVNACLTSFRAMGKNNGLSVNINKIGRVDNPFIIMVSNSNEMGYNLSLTPKASLQDGLLDVLIISKISRLKMLWLAVLILFRRVYWLKEAKSFQTKELRLARNDTAHFESQLDGELHQIEKGVLEISIKEKSLCILVP